MHMNSQGMGEFHPQPLFALHNISKKILHQSHSIKPRPLSLKIYFIKKAIPSYISLAHHENTQLQIPKNRTIWTWVEI